MPAFDVTADDGVRHQLWVISDDETVAALTGAVDALPALYIADGHHRSAAAERVAKSRGDGAQGYFLTVMFPQNEMTILDYNRVLRDLNGRSPDQLMTRLREAYAVAASDQPVRPTAPGEVGMYLAGRWHRLTLKPEIAAKAQKSADPVERLPITLLTRNIIEPIFGITDPRTDKRIDFVGGGRGLGELERLVSSGAFAVAFALYPTQMSDLMAVADAGAIMPPKVNVVRAEARRRRRQPHAGLSERDFRYCKFNATNRVSPLPLETSSTATFLPWPLSASIRV